MFFNKKEEIIDNSYKKDAIEYCTRILELEKERENNIVKNCNTIIMSNSILLIPLVIVFLEVINKLPEVRVLSIIFGLILIGVVLVGIFLSVLAQQLYKTVNPKFNDFIDIDDQDYFLDQTLEDLKTIYKKKYKNNNTRKNLLFASYICNYAFYILLAAFILVIMIVM